MYKPFPKTLKNNAMKRLIIALTILVPSLMSMAQTNSWNPYVSQGVVSPAPLLPAEFNGTGVLSFNVGNTGSSTLTLVANQEMTLVITLSKGIPNHPTDPIQALGGSALNYFTWSYNAPVRTYTGIQNQVIPGTWVGNITIQYKVVENTALLNAANGFNVNLQPPPYTNGVNSTSDDAVSSYTYVQAFDFGDAPASYGVARHEINLIKDIDGYYENYMYLGSCVDYESASQHSAQADGDDLNGFCTDDEDGVTFPQMNIGTTVIIPVSITIAPNQNIPPSGTLNIWIDWNGDGDFLDANEYVYGPVAHYNTGIVNVPVYIPLNAFTAQPTYARIRFGNNVSGPSTSPTTSSWGK
jgi:hypothetical protein